MDVSQTALADAPLQPDVLLGCSGHPAATVEAVRVVARAGRVVLVGMGADEVPFPLSRIQEFELTVTGIFRSPTHVNVETMLGARDTASAAGGRFGVENEVS